jgi:hypothetical protein
MEITSKEIKEHLELIAAKSGGRLTPEAVVEDAKRKDSPLHDLPCWLGWDQRKLASAALQDIARSLIRSVKVQITTETRTISTVAYVRDPECKSDEQGYVSLQALQDDTEKSRQAVLYEFKRAAAALERAREIAAALEMLAEIDSLLAGVEVLKAKLVVQQPQANQ